jgi:ribose-phosphate pyrophosphokinase
MMKKLVFSTDRYRYLARAIVALAPDALEMGGLVRKRFTDKELYHRLAASVKGRDIVIVGGTINDASTMEIFDLSCLMHRYKARSLEIVIPFFGYQTMERAVKPFEDVKAKNRALLLSSLIKPNFPVTVVMVDLHSEGIPEYFENGVGTEHLYAKHIVFKSIGALKGARPYVLGCTDAGRAKWCESLARELGIRIGFVFKHRADGEVIEELAISADVEGCDVFIFDDMIRTGGTLINAAKGYRAKGARDIYVISTHGVLPGKALTRLENATDDQGVKLFKRIVVTDSHPNAVRLAKGSDFLSVESIDQLLADHLTADGGVTG